LSFLLCTDSSAHWYLLKDDITLIVKLSWVIFNNLFNYLFTTLSLYSTFTQIIVVQQAKHYYLILLSYQYKAISSAYLSDSFAQNKSLNLKT